MEAWQRLLSSGLIMQAPGQAPRMMTLTARGRDVVGSVKFEEIVVSVVRQTLRREMLHAELRGSVYDNFASGNYGTSVRDAFVRVEIAVRETANLSATLVGVKLMREAFNPNTGKLTDMALPMSERERMADLFCGAIGTFKNPLSHRKVGNTDPASVIEELLFASRLLRFLR
ncbi:MAG: TIGR02391 family protein [Methylovirgula sp.]